MKVAVTGASGFIGTHLVDLLIEEGHEVIALDRHESPTSSNRSPDAFRFIAGDVRDSTYIDEAIDRDTDLVFHLAAIVGVSNYLSSPFDVVDVNLIGTKNVLSASVKTESRVVLASTSEVYGRNPKVPWAEDDDRVLGSTNVDRWSYSTSKAAAEHLTFAVHRQTGLPVSIVRYFNAYGPRQAPNYVISRAVHRTLNGRNPIIYDDGRQTRCFTFVTDVVAGTLAAGSSTAAIGEAFNLGSQVEVSVADAIRFVLDATGSDLETERYVTAALGKRYQDIVRRVPDSSKARDRLGWVASTGLEEGVGRTVEWARRHPEWLALPDPIEASDPTTMLSAP